MATLAAQIAAKFGKTSGPSQTEIPSTAKTSRPILAEGNKTAAAKAATPTTSGVDWLAPLTTKQITSQAKNTITKAYQPQYSDLNKQASDAKNLDAKRASDSKQYSAWLASQGAALEQNNSLIMQHLDQANAAAQAAGNTGLDKATSTVSGAMEAEQGAQPRSANAMLIGTEGAADKQLIAATRELGNTKTALGASQLGSSIANTYAEQTNLRQSQISDLDTALRTLSENRAKLGQAQTADIAKEIARLQGVEINKSQAQENFQAAETKLGITTANTKSEILTRQENAATAAKNADTTLTRAQQAQRNSDRTYQLNVQKFGQAKAEDTYAREHHLGKYNLKLPKAGPALNPNGKKPLTAAASSAIYNRIDTVKNEISRITSGGLDANNNPITATQAYHLILNGGIYYVHGTGANGKPDIRAVTAHQEPNSIIVNAGSNLATEGHINTNDMNALNNVLNLYGVKKRYTVVPPRLSSVANPRGALG